MLRARPLASDRSIAARRVAFARLADLFRVPRDVAVTRTVVAGRPAEWLAGPAPVRAGSCCICTAVPSSSLRARRTAS
jgi:hypothetical protein